MSLPTHKTKIVATIGPASDSVEVLSAMLRAGMNIARLNFSHGDFDSHRRIIEHIRAASRTTDLPVAIMADLSGPKIRIGTFGTEPVILKSGDRFTLTTQPVVGDQARVSVSFEPLPRVVKPGHLLFVNDGAVQLQVVESRGTDVTCTVTVGGELTSRKGLNLPDIDLGISAFTPRDRECLEFALAHGVDAVSQSFVERADDIAAVRQAARALGHDPFVIAKIERSRALEHLDEILDAADGVMIARGDLGVEVPIERIALVQKDIMRRANQRATPVITATQMLESMTTHRMPTRAEATDVANAILDGTDCVMLSAESATGAFPVDAVAMLAKIAAAIEPTRPHVPVGELYRGTNLVGRLRAEHLTALSVEACFTYAKPAVVFAPTSTGASARRMSLLRLPVWTVAVAPTWQVCQNLRFSYGVIPIHEESEPDTWNDYVRQWVRTQGPGGDLVVLTAGPSPRHAAANYRVELIEV